MPNSPTKIYKILRKNFLSLLDIILVRHIILWNLKEEYSDSEKEKIKKNIKSELEGLKGKIPGLLDIKVHISGLSSSTADLMLETPFENAEALKGYAVNSEHVHVADTFVRPFTALRSCLDFEE